MKILKRLAKIVLVLIVLLAILGVGAYFALTRWINPNDFKPQIIELVQQETGRHLTLNGNLSWTLFPNIGLELNDAALSNPAGFSQSTFASVQSVDLLVSLEALLQGEIKVNHIKVNGLQLFLISDGKRNNWSFPTSSDNTSKGNDGKSLNLMLQEIDLNNAALTYDDLVSKTHVVVSNIDFTVPNFSLTEPMELKASGDVSLDNLSGHFDMNTLFFYDQAKNMLSLTNTALNTHFTYMTEQNNNIAVVLNATGNVAVDLNKQHVNLSNVNFTLNQILNAKFNMDLQNFKALNYSGTLDIPTFSLVALLDSFGQSFPALPNKDQFNRTNFTTTFKGNLQGISLQKLNLGFGQTSVQGNLNMTRFVPLALNENLKINQLDLADFTDLNGARLLLSNIDLNGRFATTGFAPGAFPYGLEANQKIGIKDVLLKGFDLSALLNEVDAIVNNILNMKKVADSYAAIQNQLDQFKSSMGSINAANGKQTDFGSLTAETVAHHGVVTTPILSLQGPLVVVNGNGSVDLIQKSLNYHFDARVVASSRNIIKTLNIPATVSGSFSDVNANIDWVSIQAQILKFVAGQIGRTITSTVGTVISAPAEAVKGIAGALSGIFGGDKQSAGSGK